ncbi:hypothetical protein BT96DRAFT_997241 [Gymnopus androsaceus JB14]|uniref:Uncharacterized protein n=1 Tax=Gymnopus androsaceus JB14 TaxID=1447944 RepID=A0A6A4HFT2_9AGAR|nr:hypothetical protein BT96DRAFT_997241 [Gymnopus androsaceus JB14]
MQQYGFSPGVQYGMHAPPYIVQGHPDPSNQTGGTGWTFGSVGDRTDGGGGAPVTPLSTEVPINTQDSGTPNQPPVYNGSMTGPGPTQWDRHRTLDRLLDTHTHHQYMGWESNGQTLLIPLEEVEDDMAEAKDTIHINHTSQTQIEVKE